MFRAIRWIVLFVARCCRSISSIFIPDYLILKYLLTGTHKEDWVPFPKKIPELPPPTTELGMVCREANLAADEWCKRMEHKSILSVLHDMDKNFETIGEAPEKEVIKNHSTACLANGMVNRIWQDISESTPEFRNTHNHAIVASLSDFNTIKKSLHIYNVPYIIGTFARIDFMRGTVNKVLLVEEPGHLNCNVICSSLYATNSASVSFFRLYPTNIYNLPLKAFFYERTHKPNEL